MRSKFEIMRANCSKLRADSSFALIKKAMSDSMNAGLGNPELRNLMPSDGQFYNAQRGSDLSQYGLGGLFRQPNLPPSKQGEKADLSDAILDQPDVQVAAMPARGFGIWRLYARQFSMRVRELCKKFAQLFR